MPPGNVSHKIRKVFRVDADIINKKSKAVASVSVDFLFSAVNGAALGVGTIKTAVGRFAKIRDACQKIKVNGIQKVVVFDMVFQFPFEKPCPIFGEYMETAVHTSDSKLTESGSAKFFVKENCESVVQDKGSLDDG